MRCGLETERVKSENMGQNGYISTLSNDEECSGLSKVSRYIYVNIMRVLSSCTGLFPPLRAQKDPFHTLVGFFRDALCLMLTQAKLQIIQNFIKIVSNIKHS